MLSNCKLLVKLYKISCLSLGNLAKMLFWSQLLSLVIFELVSLMRENLRGLRENLYHKIRSQDIEEEQHRLLDNAEF